MNTQEFIELLNTIAKAWNKADAVRAIECFTEDAIYMEPPDQHFFQGREQLLALFRTLSPNDNWQWHNIWFDEKSQTGAGEFTFAKDQAHGVAVIEIDGGRVKLWREYQWHGQMPWDQFADWKNRKYKYTFANYPHRNTSD